MKTNYQFKITLAGSDPTIWRKVVVPSTFTLEQLHEVIQACFDWDGYHLYAFELFGKMVDDQHPSSLTKQLSALELKEKSKFKYIYDFGDDWLHMIELEKIIPDDGVKDLPTCLTGKRAGPPEDCGGIWGYESKLAVLADKTHPDYEDISEWMGDDITPEVFDIAGANKRLAEIR